MAMTGLTQGGQLAMSALWLALYAQWLPIPSIILPDQVAGIMGGASHAREAVTGLIVAAGATMSLVITPLAGALSDRTGGVRGRRRPFLIGSVPGILVALALLGAAGRYGGLVLYGLAFVHLQFWWNAAAGPYAGLIPDVVPPERQAMATGWMNVLIIAGMIIGNLLVIAFYVRERPALIMVLYMALTIACLLVTLRVREPPAAGDLAPDVVRRPFWPSRREHPYYYLVLATRLLSNMGLWSVFTFLLFYLEDVLGLDPVFAGNLLPALFVAGAVLGVPASLFGARLCDRVGPVPVVQGTSWIMAGATACYALIALHPSVLLAAPVIVVFSVATGAYGAVDWLLALRVLPRGQDSGKDMGIWHICMVLPQVAGPLVGGLLISWVRTAGSVHLAYGLAFGVAAGWFVLASALVGRVRLP